MSKAHSTAKAYNKYRYVIGIDPGTHTGIAVWDRKDGAFKSIQTKNIIEAMNDVLVLGYAPESTDIVYRLLVIEDARTRSGTDAAKMGAGSIRRDCAIWQEFSEYHAIDILWRATPRGKTQTTKLPAATFKKLTGWDARTSHHARDAAMLVWKT